MCKIDPKCYKKSPNIKFLIGVKFRIKKLFIDGKNVHIIKSIFLTLLHSESNICISHPVRIYLKTCPTFPTLKN